MIYGIYWDCFVIAIINQCCIYHTTAYYHTTTLPLKKSQRLCLWKQALKRFLENILLSLMQSVENTQTSQMRSFLISPFSSPLLGQGKTRGECVCCAGWSGLSAPLCDMVRGLAAVRCQVTAETFYWNLFPRGFCASDTEWNTGCWDWNVRCLHVSPFFLSQAGAHKEGQASMCTCLFVLCSSQVMIQSRGYN